MENISDEYVNVKDALNRIGGSMDLYKRLLTSFAGKDHMGPLDAALSSGNAEDTARELHTLKGVSANLSLIKLSAVVGSIEHMVKDGIDYTDKIAELKSVYEITLGHIAEIL